MKKFYMMFVAVAAMTTISCNKELGQNDGVAESKKGTLIQVAVGNPESCIDDTMNSSDEIDTKVSSFVPQASNKTPKWDAGDSFQIFSYNAAKIIVTDWDKFVTVDGSTSPYNANATFIGYIPEGFTQEAGGNTFSAIVTNEFNSAYTFAHDSAKTRYTFNCNIPSEQDGTGLKYSLFGSTLTYDENTKALSGFRFQFKSALCALTLPAGSNIVKIEITMSYENENFATSQFLATKTGKQNLKWQADNFTFLSGGDSKTITIYNDGAVLPEDTVPVYFACVRTNSGGTAGGNNLGACILTFQFTNQDGLVATKTITLKNEETGKYLNIQNGNQLNNFGAVTFAEGDFQTVS